MDVDLLKRALNDRNISRQATESARSAAVSARQNTRATVSRLDESVQRDVAKAVGANVALHDSKPTEDE
jgi:hypothetical protein